MKRRQSEQSLHRAVGTEVRFFRYVSPEPTSGCWLWSGSTDRRGYGQLRFGRKLRYATHVSLELAGRPVSGGLCALHRCDNGNCVNPDHLFVGTQLENIADMRVKGRHVNPPRAVGENNHASKLTNEAVRQIRLARQNGGNISALARQFGVSVAAACYAARGQTWRG